jgi:hypothetical protein
MHSNIPLGGDLVPLAQSYYTEVAHLEQSDVPKPLVVKITQSSLVREPYESDTEFYSRRLKEAESAIRGAREAEAAVIGFISQTVPELVMPREEWFVFTADDGFPLSGRIQEEIKGKRLKEYGLENLSHSQIDTLTRLLEANVDCYEKYGINLDIYGSSNDEENYLRLKQLVFGMLRRSVNLIITEEGEVGLIDLRFTNMGKFIELTKHIRTKADLTYLKRLRERVVA